MLWQRQLSIVQELYGEVFALELLVQQVFVSCEDVALRSKLAKAIHS